MQLAHMTWPQVEEYLKNDQQIIIPVGSTEQHGPTGLFNTDYTTSNCIAIEVGERMDVLVAPPVCYGMAEHHLGFPGTISIRPQTYMAYILDVIRSLAGHGFDDIYFLNGHGGNIAPLTAAFSEAIQAGDTYRVHVVNWFNQAAVQDYEAQHFGEENGFHATCGEVSVTMMEHPEAFKNIEPLQFKVEKKAHAWPLGAKEFRKTFPDGRMASNPGLASPEHGKKLFEIAVESVVKTMQGS